jgi:excisionase family DNA binding protein
MDRAGRSRLALAEFRRNRIAFMFISSLWLRSEDSDGSETAAALEPDGRQLEVTPVLLGPGRDVTPTAHPILIGKEWQGTYKNGRSRQTMAVALRFVPTWRSLDEAAQQTGIGRRTLSRWVAQGKLTAYTRAGDRRRFVDLDDIRKLQELRPLQPKND